MATKAQLIQFIIDNFSEADGTEISKQRLDRFKKAELEEFISYHQLNDDLVAWLN